MTFSLGAENLKAPKVRAKAAEGFWSLEGQTSAIGFPSGQPKDIYGNDNQRRHKGSVPNHQFCDQSRDGSIAGKEGLARHGCGGRILKAPRHSA